MRLKTLSMAASLAAVVGIFPVNAIAALTPVWAYTSATVSGYDNLDLGYRFTATTDESILEVGWWDATGNGFNGAHVINVWSNAGTLLATTTLDLGTTDTLIDGFRFKSIAPLQLTAGSSYVISGSTTPADGWAGAGQIAGFQVNDPGITIGPNASLYSYTTNPNIEPNSFFLGSEYAGPNFILGNSTIPEPATMSVLAVALAAVGMWRRRARG